MKNIFLFVFSLLLFGCSEISDVTIASFEQDDRANKAFLLLNEYGIPASILTEKETNAIIVSKADEVAARELLTDFNFYFSGQDVTPLLDSSFASLSKLEMVKENLFASMLIQNNLGSIPNVINAKAIVTGTKQKNITVLILSFQPLSSDYKSEIDKLVRGLSSSDDKVTISYIVEELPSENA